MKRTRINRVIDRVIVTAIQVSPVLTSPQSFTLRTEVRQLQIPPFRYDRVPLTKVFEQPFDEVLYAVLEQGCHSDSDLKRPHILNIAYTTDTQHGNITRAIVGLKNTDTDFTWERVSQ